MQKWRLFIDTGGTFTDCIAYDPQDQVHRIKVLSSSALRGRLLAPAENAWSIQINWSHQAPIFEGYQLSVLGQPGQWKVLHLDPQQKRLELDKALPPEFAGLDFEITGHEEAPILAARLLTETPLRGTLPPLEMRLGSTKGTNALLEQKGAKVGLLITQGLGDLLEIGTQQRPALFALNVQKPPQIYHQVWEVPERLAADCSVVQALDLDQIEQWINAGAFEDCDSIAIALLHSYRNPIHELQIQTLLAKHKIPYLSASHLLAPEIKLVPRAQTAVVNAYLAPVMEQYLQAVQAPLAQDSLKVMTSAGGLIGAEHFQAKDSLLSGPAGGIVGAVWAAQKAGITNILTLDMGGTSTDVARYDGAYSYKYAVKVGHAELLSPALAIETVAAGGGSICSFDGEKLQVGPESAGAFPGPACYGAGGPLTVTDVNLLLGQLDPDSFPVPISLTAAQNALTELCAASGLNEAVLLAGFSRIANEKMAAAIRNISVQQGYNPAEYSLLSFGGAGGQHACAVAKLLGMQQVLIPYEASILSARGMGQAVIERFASKQCLRAFREADPLLSQEIETLKQQALTSLEKENAQQAQASIKAIWLQMRIKGQDASLSVLYEADQEIMPRFRSQYEQLYGHWIAGRAIELVSIRVSAVLQTAREAFRAAALKNYLPPADGKVNQFARYHWEKLQPGAQIEGPALLQSQFTTVVVPQDWELSLDHNLSAILRLGKSEESLIEKISEDSLSLDPIQLELFMHRFQSIAEEMGALLERTSFSVNVKERLDFSCALLDADGYLVVNAPHIPVHLGSLGLCVRKVAAKIDLGPGDVVITNHPAYGGSHLPDITLIRAIFDQDGKRIAYLANRAHHAEVGGKRPGSMPPDATNLAEEGVVFPPMYMVKAGVGQWAEIEAHLASGPYPSRAIHENIADLNAGLASLQIGATRLEELAAAHGEQKLRFYMQALQDYTQRSLSKSLEKLPDQVFGAAERLDDGSKLQVKISKKEDRLSFDFSGSAAVHPANLNANEAIVNSVVMYVLRLMLEEEIPLNEGLMQKVDLNIPTGILSPRFADDPTACPAVVGGNVETSQRLVDTIIKALALAACSQGTMNNLLFGNEEFGYYETICGGVGAGPGFAGADAVHQHMTNTRITDPEIMELRYPVRLERFAIRHGSGGKGQWQGGNGIIREIRFLAPLALTILSQHREVAPYGLAGGEAGKKGIQWVERRDKNREDLLGIAAVEIEKGDMIHLESPGGGGYGSWE